jgi:hypothetical protein
VGKADASADVQDQKLVSFWEQETRKKKHVPWVETVLLQPQVMPTVKFIESNDLVF